MSERNRAGYPDADVMMNKTLTRDIIAKTKELLLLGNYFATAMEAQGIPHTLGIRWLNAGITSEHGSIYGDFRMTVVAAQAEAETRLVEGVQKSEENARGYLEILKRRFPDRWSEKVKLTVVSELEAFMDHLQANLTPAEYEKVLRITANRATEAHQLAAETTVDMIAEADPGERN